ncbi:hypothetical protein BCR36DRAFT_365546 [Piromyces finnis]|uniref:Uncharacterized protein n=1 Tax=Piromyces finnis TaxID=1754191 RepID=A0A1Y1VNH9_9FUNG|nr:hypothetical protein BCR36DRAFT_365546 [Piromyces finnis]|eukprot:ORX60959.1 hypothetical protein BCR36DRAFT_365546 [Piromyces finnis]
MEEQQQQNENENFESPVIYPPILNKAEKVIFPFYTKFVTKLPFNNFTLILLRILEDIQWLLFSLRENWFEGSSYFHYNIINNLSSKTRFYYQKRIYNKKISLSIINLTLHSIFGYIFAKYYINPYILSKNIILSRGSSMIIEKLFILRFIMLLDIDILKKILRNVESMIIAVVVLFDVLYSYITSFPYYEPNINYASISLAACALYQALFSLICNLHHRNTHTAWLICMFSSILVFPLVWIYARYKYNKLVNEIYKNIQEKKILQKKKISKEYLNKLDSKQLIESMEDIYNKSLPKIKKNMFKNELHCEIACRFIRNNRNPEAYQLMKYIFSEGILQYSDCTKIYINFWFYFYSLRTFLYDNYRKLSSYMDNSEIKNMNQLIEIAKSKKPTSRETFLITLAIHTIEKEEKKLSNGDNHKIEITNTSIEYRLLKSSAIEYHVKALNEVKVLLKSLKASSNIKDTYYYIDCIKNLAKYENKCYSKYNELISKYEKTKSILHLYVIFIVNIMNQPEHAVNYYI